MVLTHKDKNFSVAGITFKIFLRCQMLDPIYQIHVHRDNVF